MKLTAAEFQQWEHKSVTLLGMSGIGKTRLSAILRKDDWFHYSGDCRIGTHYLDEAILDNIKQQAMQMPFLRDLLRSDSIHIRNNISVDHLKPVATFLGKVGNPEHGGLPMEEFKRRQRLHHTAEIAAMNDVPAFIEKAHSIYGFKHFINDAGGSVCELDSPETIDVLAKHTLIVYIKTSDDDEQRLIERAKKSPKPLYYREAFLLEQMAVYLQDRKLDYVAQVEPDDFVRWIFPRLFNARIPRYDAIAAQHGYTITTEELAQVVSTDDFLALITRAIERQA